MNLSIESFNYDKDLFKLATELRFKIFVDEFAGDKFSEFDSNDLTAIHYLLYFNSICVGVARVSVDVHKFCIDRFGVLNKYRSRGFGTVFIRFIINDLTHASKKIYLQTNTKSIKFFENNNFKFSENINSNLTELVFDKK